MIDNETDIVRVAALDRVEAEVESNGRADEEVSVKIRASMETERSERERE